MKSAKKILKPRDKIRFLLLDFPADHEVDDFLLTESQVIKSLLSNAGNRTRLIRCSSMKRFKEVKWRPMPAVTYVHIAGHGNPLAIEMIDGKIPWPTLAKKLKIAMPPLKKGQKRVLTLSCCFSENAFKLLKKDLVGHFTGCYRINRKRANFDDAMTVWLMFYNRKRLDLPHGAIVEKVNSFFARKKDLLAFHGVK